MAWPSGHHNHICGCGTRRIPPSSPWITPPSGQECESGKICFEDSQCGHDAKIAKCVRQSIYPPDLLIEYSGLSIKNIFS